MRVDLLIYTLVGISLGPFIFGMFCFIGSELVSYDSKKIEAQFIRQLAEHHATDKQIGAITMRFKKNLDNLLRQYAKKHKVVILDRRSILAGSKDITNELSQELSDSMRNKI